MSEGKPVSAEVLADYPDLKPKKSKATAFRDQWQAIKDSHEGSIVLMKMGDFYEGFYEDAPIVADVLGVTQTTGRNGAPLAGVPAVGIDAAVKKLVAAGHRVALAEQGAAPKKAKATGGAGMAAAGTDGYGIILPDGKNTRSARPEPKLPATDEAAVEGDAVLGDMNAGVFAKAVDEILKVVAPGARGPEAERAALIIRKHLAEMHRRAMLAQETVGKGAIRFWLMSRKKIKEFIDAIESGEIARISSPKLRMIAATLAKAYDSRIAEVRAFGKGHLETLIENYFAHLWKNPTKASSVYAQILGKRPLEGSKGFLKQRTIMRFAEGVDTYGLDPVTWNPVHMTLLKMAEMDRYIMAQNLIRDLKAEGLVRFNYSRSKTPEGHTRINDNMFTVYMPPYLTVKEAYDQTLVDNLMDFARSMGIDTQRLMKMGGQRWGDANEVTEQVRTKFAGPESVLIHEVGHILGFRYKLFDTLRRKGDGTWHTITRGKNKGQNKFVPNPDAVAFRQEIDKEWRALADARYGDSEVSDNFKKYVRKKAEKEAVLLEAFLHAPEQMQELAPKLMGLFKKFLADNAELHPLLDIKGSVVLGTSEGQLKVPGFTTLGFYVAPEPVARLLNNLLAPGLRGSGNQIISGGYDLLRKAGNSVTQAQLLGLFHAGFTTISLPFSQLGQGIRNIFAKKGLRLRGLAQAATAPVAPALALVRGRKLRRAVMTQTLEAMPPDIRVLAEGFIAAGGRMRMPGFYYNAAVKQWAKSVDDLVRGYTKEQVGAALKLPVLSATAALESVMWPVLGMYVPTLKAGMWSMLAQDEMVRLKNEDATDPEVHRMLLRAWDSIDNRLGQLVYDNIFWNKTQKDAMMLSARAVGWNWGYFREYLVGPAVDLLTTRQRLKQGDALISFRMAELGGTVIGLAVVGAILQAIMTGKPPEEPKDYFFPRTGRLNPDGSEERISLPTYAKDFYGWFTRPQKMAVNKMQPIWAMLSRMAENEDFWGTEIRHPDDPIVTQFMDLAKYAGSQMIPFSVKNYERMRKSGASKTFALLSSTFGVLSAPGYVTKTPAQVLMTQHIVARLPRGKRNKEQFAKAELRRELRQRARLGEDIRTLAIAQELTAGERTKIMREAKADPFALLFNRLTFTEALDVFAVATEKEQAATIKILRGKMYRAKKVTPEQRQLANELLKAAAARK